MRANIRIKVKKYIEKKLPLLSNQTTIKEKKEVVAWKMKWINIYIRF